MTVKNPFGIMFSPLEFPINTHIITMKQTKAISNPPKAIYEALDCPISSKSLREIAQEKKSINPNATCVILVSDNTRPVPYKGEQGILLPAINILFECGYKRQEILILIATGTHRAMSQQEINFMIDSKIINMGIEIINHDCNDNSKLRYIGDTKRGTRIMINSRYLDADLKIATGLVESHFMAGASGGRKAICPGIIGKESTYVFHGPELMAHEKATDLILQGNPVHEESLEVAKAATVDFLMNVTLDHDFNITGLFFGDLEAAHYQAVDFIKDAVNVPVEKPSDIVITHAGFVGINHYQTAKCAVASLGVLKENGYLIIIADMTDKKNIIGGLNYRTTLSLLKILGSDNFVKAICSPDWTFIPDQWQVQQWAKVFKRIPENHMILYSPMIDKFWWPNLPGINGQDIMGENNDASRPECYSAFIKAALNYISKLEKKPITDFDIAYIKDGPYVVPRVSCQL